METVNNKDNKGLAAAQKSKKTNWTSVALVALLLAAVGEMAYLFANKPKHNAQKKIAEQQVSDNEQDCDYSLLDEQAQEGEPDPTSDVHIGIVDGNSKSHHADASPAASRSNASRQHDAAPRAQERDNNAVAAVQQQPSQSYAQATPRNNNSGHERWINEESEGTVITPIDDNNRYTPQMSRPVQGRGSYHKGYAPSSNQNDYQPQGSRHSQGYYNQYSRRFRNRR